MTTWRDLLTSFSLEPDQTKGDWLDARLQKALSDVSEKRSGNNVILYGSAFLQKSNPPADFLSISFEDINAFMSVVNGMDFSKGLTLILHTPGGRTNATESIVMYLRSKFSAMEVIVPTFAMSAGTMISLASDRIVLGRHSQLGPIDPQMGNGVSARAVVEQFERAKREIQQDLTNAHVWAPINQTLGPALLQECQNALDYSEEIVGRWLRDWMFKELPDAESKGKDVARYFNDASTHKSHGRRIGRNEARQIGVVVEELEGDGRQELQESVLTAYHVATLMFEHSQATKIVVADTGQRWLKNFLSIEEQAALAASAGALNPAPPVQPASPPPLGPGPNRAERRRQQRQR